MCIGEEQKEVWGVQKLMSEEGKDGRGTNCKDQDRELVRGWREKYEGERPR